MYEIFWIIMIVAVNSMAKRKILPEIFSLLKDIVSRQDIKKFEEYILGESFKIKRALSREHMLSEGVLEEHVDFVIQEIKLFISKVKITDEIRSQCGYENMELADLLWCEYCRINGKDKSEEYENDLKKGLFVVAKAWNEPFEESVKSCIEFLKRIDSKSSNILLNVREVKNDTEDIKEDVKNADRKLEEVNSGIAEMNCRTQNMDSTLREVHQLLLSKSKEEQTVDEQENHDSREQEGERGISSSVNVSHQEAADAEEITSDEIMIYLAAAPAEFQKDIDSLKEFIEEQNHCQDAVRLRLQCYDGEMVQDIQKCKYCYILAGFTVEEWMRETYEQVYRLNYNGACDDKSIKLRLFFKRMSDGETAQADHSGREELKNRYKKDFNQLPFEFNDTNRIKLDILQNLRCEVPKVNFSTKSILQFRNNTDFEKACKKRDALQAQYVDASEIFNTDKSSEEKEKMETLEEELKAQNEIVQRMKKDIWDNLNLLTDKQQNKNTMDVREVEAIESVIEYGNYNEAEALLRNKQWNQEIVDLERFMKEKKVMLRRFISARRTLISNLKTKGMGSSLEDEIIEIYERITGLSKEWHVEYITIYEYAEFLLNQRKYREGIKVGEDLKCLYGLSDCASVEDRVSLLKLLGDLYYRDKKYKEGERNYREALGIFKNGTCENWELRAKIYIELAKLLWKTNQLGQAEKGLEINIASLSRLVKREPDIYEPVLADTYNYMGILANRKNQLDEALEYHYKALEIRGRLAEKSSSYNYRPIMDLTSTYNNLAIVYKKRGEYRKAEECYKKAIEIRSRNEMRNPSVFRPAVAWVYSNYAALLNVSGNNEEAQRICEKAYAIRRALAQKNPSYKVELASTLHEYGIILTDVGERMYLQAKRYFEEAIEIRENLSDEDEMTYGLNLAETCCSYGKLLAKMGDFPVDEKYYRKAEQNMERACDICNRYSEKNNGYDIDKISEIYYSFALLLNGRLKKYSDAEVYYKKAIEGFRELTNRCRQVFEPKLKKAEEDLTEMQGKIHEIF